MEPIVSPWFIYFISVADSINTWLVIFAVAAGIVCIGGLLFWFIGGMDYGFDDDDTVFVKIVWKRALIIFIPLLIVSILFPNRNNILMMYGASKVTPNFIEKTVDIGKTAKDELKADIIEMLEAATKDKEE